MEARREEPEVDRSHGNAECLIKRQHVLRAGLDHDGVPIAKLNRRVAEGDFAVRSGGDQEVVEYRAKHRRMRALGREAFDGLIRLTVVHEIAQYEYARASPYVGAERVPFSGAKARAVQARLRKAGAHGPVHSVRRGRNVAEPVLRKCLVRAERSERIFERWIVNQR